MPTLHTSIIIIITIDTFKIQYKIQPVYLHDLIPFKNTMFSFKYKNLHVVDVPRVHTSRYGKAAFGYEAVHLWNSLKNSIVF